jgi:hypothetical protein
MFMKKIITACVATCLLCSLASAQKRLAFSPATHGFHFVNSFHTSIDIGGHTDGLCGGMVLAAFNFFRYNVAIPQLTDKDIDYSVTCHISPFSTSGTTALVDYIFHSQIALYTTVNALPFLSGNDPLYETEYNKIMERIEKGTYAILGLKLRPGVGGMGHQVLCYGYNPNNKELYIYDPNFPGQEVVLCAAAGGIVLKSTDGGILSDHYRAFFEEQELFANKTSEMTEYNLVSNFLQNQNFAVRPPGVAPRPAMAGFGYNNSGIDYERELPPQDIYKFQIAATSKMVEVEDALLAKGTRVQQFAGYESNGPCDGKNQQWLLIPAGIVGTERVFYIINFGFLKYLEAGADATLQQPNENNNQRWFIQPSGVANVYHIKSVAAQTYLELPVGSVNDGDRLKLGNFTGASNQQFRFTKYVGNTGPQAEYRYGAYVNLCSAADQNKDINLTDGSADNGANIKLYDVQSGAKSMHWKLERTSDGYYKFINRLVSSKCLDVTGWEANNGSALVSWDIAAVDKQKWLVIPVVRDAGSYIFFNKVSGKCISVAGGGPRTGGLIETYSYKGENFQKWKLLPARE